MFVEPKGYYDFVTALNNQMDAVNQNKSLEGNALTKFNHAFDREQRAGGAKPVVCVIGKHDFDELMATLSMVYGMPIVHEKSTEHRLREYMGMVLVPSYSVEQGFYFGSEDQFFREQQETKQSKERELAEKIADNIGQNVYRDRTYLIEAVEKVLKEHKDGSP